MTLEQLALDVLGLSARERAILAQQIIASLEDEAVGDVEALWAEVAENRLRQVTENKVSLRPVEVALAEIKSKLGR